MSNLAQIIYCPECNEPNFYSNTNPKGFCSPHCEGVYEEKEEKEERIVNLEKEVASLKRKLKLCLDKLEIDDISEESI